MAAKQQVIARSGGRLFCQSGLSCRSAAKKSAESAAMGKLKGEELAPRGASKALMAMAKMAGDGVTPTAKAVATNERVQQAPKQRPLAAAEGTKGVARGGDNPGINVSGSAFGPG
eukprot:2359731-Prymnesium_polylepis.1